MKETNVLIIIVFSLTLIGAILLGGVTAGHFTAAAGNHYQSAIARLVFSIRAEQITG